MARTQMLQRRQQMPGLLRIRNPEAGPGELGLMERTGTGIRYSYRPEEGSTLPGFQAEDPVRERYEYKPVEAGDLSDVGQQVLKRAGGAPARLLDVPGVGAAAASVKAPQYREPTALTPEQTKRYRTAVEKSKAAQRDYQKSFRERSRGLIGAFRRKYGPGGATTREGIARKEAQELEGARGLMREARKERIEKIRAGGRTPTPQLIDLGGGQKAVYIGGKLATGAAPKEAKRFPKERVQDFPEYTEEGYGKGQPRTGYFDPATGKTTYYEGGAGGQQGMQAGTGVGAYFRRLGRAFIGRGEQPTVRRTPQARPSLVEAGGPVREESPTGIGSQTLLPSLMREDMGQFDMPIETPMPMTRQQKPVGLQRPSWWERQKAKIGGGPEARAKGLFSFSRG